METLQNSNRDLVLSASVEDEEPQCLEALNGLSSPCPTHSATSPASVQPSALPPNAAPSGSISLEANVPFATVAELQPPGPSEQISSAPSSIATPAAVSIPKLSTAAVVKSPTLTTVLPDVLSPPESTGGSILGNAPDKSAASFLSHAPPPLPAAAMISSAMSHLGAEQQLTLNQVALPTPQSSQAQLQQQTPAVQQQLHTMVTEQQTPQVQQAVPMRELQSQHQPYQEQAQLQQHSKLQQSLMLQQQQQTQKQIPQSNMTEVQMLPQQDPTELPVSLQQTQKALAQKQPPQYAQHLLQQPQLQQMPQQGIAPPATTQQQGQIDHQQQQLHLQQTAQFQQKHMALQQQQQLFMSAVVLNPDQTHLLPLPGSHQLFQQQKQLSAGPVQSQQIVQQTPLPAEVTQQSLQTHVTPQPFEQQQQEMVKATDATPIQQRVPLQKQSSLQMSESEASTGDTSVPEDMWSHSASFYPTLDSSLLPLHQGAAETSAAALSHTLTPSPAQPSSVAESDSEGPPKIEYVDNRIKTLDEKLRNLLYQEYSSGAPMAGGATSGPASTASSSVGGDKLAEPQSFPPLASSSDTSPHSSSSSTSSTTSRSSSTSPGPPERVGAGKEGPSVSQLLTVEEQPSSSVPSTSTSSTPLASLLPTKQVECVGPQRPPVPAEPAILVSDQHCEDA